MVRRFDGRPARGLPAYRRLMPHLMRGRNEAAVYFEQTVDLSETLPWLERYRRERGGRVTVFTLLLWGLARVLHERPRLNRFVAGRRIHDRDGVYISFAAKKRLDDDAPLSTVKRRFEPDEGFDQMVAALSAGVDEARSDRRSSVDRELGLLARLPPLVVEGAVRLVSALDFFNLAPRALLEHDPMYTSVFVANLGSLEIDAAYHHLYEYGTCPLFVTLGRVKKAPWVTADGAIEVRPQVRLKYTFDERVEDGLYCARALALLEQYLAQPAAHIALPEQ
jgi:hypothetical protein